jgi:hypothetical protein
LEIILNPMFLCGFPPPGSTASTTETSVASGAQ